MAEIEIPEHDDVPLSERDGDCDNCGPTTKSVITGAPAMLFFPTDDARFRVNIEVCQSCGSIMPVEFDTDDIDTYSDVYMSILDEYELISEEELEEIYGE